MLTRRAFLAATSAGMLAARPSGLVVDTHIHLFAADRERFPRHPDAPYDPEPRDLESYKDFIRKGGPDHAVIVHPEPYQDDHSYLEYCLVNEPRPGFFKGTCLYDALDPEAPAKMKALTERHPGKIVAVRVHSMDDRGAAPATSGPIKNRDLGSSEMKRLIRAATDLGLAVQMHFRPHYAPPIDALAAEFSSTPFLLDHLGRSGMGTAAELEPLMALSKRANTYMKLSGVGYSSKTDFPHLDARPVVRRAFDGFGPDRMMWGGVGYDVETFEKNLKMFEQLLDFASAEDRAKVRGLTAKKLFDFGE